MLHTLIGPLPAHLYVWVDTTFTHRRGRVDNRYEPAVWFGLVSTPGRMWGCTVLLESGAVYRNLPPQAICFVPDADPLSPWQAQTWDCYGTDFAVVDYPYLSGLRCLVKTGDTTAQGRHLFAVAPVGDGFSAEPSQAKEFHFLALEEGRLTIQPTDRVVYEDRSFTGPLAFPAGLRRQTEVYRCE
ncbi:MAG: hypothetical protein O3A25_19190 [Acidobacteria bacterium]|nr:hypothetical protein [Acidobacteriota bacterium]